MKNYTANPVKLSQPAGAAMAFMGIKNCVPLWHGVQGCTAFAKILFIQHFREPMPFQTTALTHTSVVMGGDENALEAMNVVKKDGRLIALLTTGVAETSGSDIKRLINTFKTDNPGVMAVAVHTPDYEGSLETGYVKACAGLLEYLAKPRTAPRRKQVAVFAGPYVTPGEVEALREMIEDFGLRPVMFPDLGDSLFGYVTEADYNPSSIGGTPIEEVETLADSAFIISVGRSMKKLSGKFATANSVPVYHFDHLATLDELDTFYKLLAEKSGMPVPLKYRKKRRHLQDAMLDTQFYFRGRSAAMAGDNDFLIRYIAPLADMGIPVKAVSALEGDYPSGDLEDLAGMISDHGVDILLGNSHVAELGARLGIPVVRCGIPVYDRIGEPQSIRIGYTGAAQLYREIANVLTGADHATTPYISSLKETLR